MLINVWQLERNKQHSLRGNFFGTEKRLSWPIYLVPLTHVTDILCVYSGDGAYDLFWIRSLHKRKFAVGTSFMKTTRVESWLPVDRRHNRRLQGRRAWAHMQHGDNCLTQGVSVF